MITEDRFDTEMDPAAVALSTGEPSPTVSDGDTRPSLALKEALPKRLGRYELIEPVGKGASATVYRARRDDGHIMALKVLSAGVAANEDRLVRFYHEARLLMRIQHTNVIDAYEVGKDRGKHYLAMEFIDGETLGDLIKRRGRLPEKTALKAVICLARALHAVHRLGFLHRDVSLRNIMISRRGEVKLCDFEYGKEPTADLDLTCAGRGLGTPDFMSPEQFHRAKDVDPRADIYSVGVALYYMLTGRSPFPGTNYLDKWVAKSRNHYLPPDIFVPRLSKATRVMIRRAMAARPDDRPATARMLEQDALCALEALRQSRGVKRRLNPPANPNETPRLNVWSVVFLNEEGTAGHFTATKEQILQLIERKAIGPDARATLLGRTDYRRLVDLPDFRVVFQATAMSKAIQRLSTGGKSRLSRWLDAWGNYLQRAGRVLAGRRRKA